MGKGTWSVWSYIETSRASAGGVSVETKLNFPHNVLLLNSGSRIRCSGVAGVLFMFGARPERPEDTRKRTTKVVLAADNLVIVDRLQ